MVSDALYTFTSGARVGEGVGAGNAVEVAVGPAAATVGEGWTVVVRAGAGLGAAVAVGAGSRAAVAVALAVGTGVGVAVPPHAAQNIAMLAAKVRAKTSLLMGGLYPSAAPLSTCFDNSPRQLIMDCRVVATASLPRRFYCMERWML